jgi:uncharacterized protein (TIGR03435 family)
MTNNHSTLKLNCAGIIMLFAAASWVLAIPSAFAQDASVPHIEIPPPVHSVRAAHPVPGMIQAQQDGYPAEIRTITQGATNWIEEVTLISRTRAEIVSARVGWAYAMPAGLEFHQSDVLKLKPGLLAGGTSFPLQDLNVPPRADAKDLVVFVAQVTFPDKSVYNYDQAKVAAFYKDCCTGTNAGRVPPVPQGRLQPGMPGGEITPGKMPPMDLKPINFDVVSFRRTEKRGAGREFPLDGDFISYHGSPIEGLILFAHIGSNGYTSIANEPDWVKTELYDFTAKVAAEDVDEWKKMTLTNKRAMVGNLLADVLKLKVHQQDEPQPVYDLVVAKGGPKLMDYHAGDTLPIPGRAPVAGHVMAAMNMFYVTGQDATMADLVNFLSGPQRAGRVVIDKTGLTGTYDFALGAPPLSLPPVLQQAADDAGVPTLQEGLKQLGLALVPSKGPVDEIVIDHIERPDTN